MYSKKHLYFYIYTSITPKNKIYTHKKEIGNNSTIYVIPVVVYRCNYDTMSVLTTYITMTLCSHTKYIITT